MLESACICIQGVAWLAAEGFEATGVVVGVEAAGGPGVVAVVETSDAIFMVKSYSLPSLYVWLCMYPQNQATI